MPILCSETFPKIYSYLTQHFSNLQNAWFCVCVCVLVCVKQRTSLGLILPILIFGDWFLVRLDQRPGSFRNTPISTYPSARVRTHGILYWLLLWSSSGEAANPSSHTEISPVVGLQVLLCLTFYTLGVELRSLCLPCEHFMDPSTVPAQNPLCYKPSIWFHCCKR